MIDDKRWEDLKRLIYTPRGSKLSDLYINSISFCNCIIFLQELMDEQDEIMLGDREVSLSALVEQTVAMTTHIPQLTKYESTEYIKHLKSETKVFFNYQDMVTDTDFREYKKINTEFVKLFWEDIETFKSLEGVREYIKNEDLQGFHNLNINPHIRHNFQFLVESLSEHRELLGLYNLFKLDETYFTYYLCCIDKETKIKHINYYNSEKLGERNRKNNFDYMLEYIRTA